MTVLRVLPHFVPANWPFTCSECLEEFPQDSLMMTYTEPQQPTSGRNRPGRTVHLCEDCGKLLLESL